MLAIGQKKAIAIAIRNVSGRRRWSKLDEWPQRGVESRRPFPPGGERDEAWIP
jgi:exodeoxyribonuclease V alpha subunit